MESKQRKTNRGIVYFIAKFVLSLFYIPVYRIKVIGRENIPADGAVILCSNHVAIKDPLLISSVVRRRIFYMAKAELFKNKFLGAILRCVGTFPVARGTGGADALDEADRLLNEGRVVGIFIEGTRSKTGQLQRPKTGAALLHYRTKAAVVPVCISSANGRRPAPFKRTIIEFGKPLTAEELNINDESSLNLRRASRRIMEDIAAMRASAEEMLGIPAPAEPEQTQSEKAEQPKAETEKTETVPQEEEK